jgi:hypothetical protein
VWARVFGKHTNPTVKQLRPEIQGIEAGAVSKGIEQSYLKRGAKLLDFRNKIVFPNGSL